MPRRQSVRTQLLLAISAVMVLGLAVVLLLDYRSEKAERLAEKRAALQDEAALLLPMIRQLRHHGIDSVQSYVDEACAQVQETTSPGHHIAVELGTTAVQARTHHRASPEMLSVMRRALDRQGEARVSGQPILVGSAAQGDLRTYVSEYVSNVLEASRQQLLERSAGIASVGLVAIGLTNLILVRLIARPVDRLVAVVRQIGNGQIGTTKNAAPEIFNSAEFQFLAEEVGAMSKSLAAAERQRRQQLDKAQRIQQKLHPTAETAGGWRIASLYRPADQVGGDYLDFKLVGEHLLIACVADVSGHGISAAMGAAMLKTLFEAAVRISNEPAEILRFINDSYAAVSLDEDFASMIVVAMDRQRRRLAHASAGHEPSYILRPDNPRATMLQSTGPLLGIENDARWEQLESSIRPGDRLVLPTDGWAETVLGNGELLGRQALAGIFTQGHALTPRQQVGHALSELAARSSACPSDDLTLLIID